MGWIILGAIVAGFTLLLLQSIVLHARYDDTLGESMEEKLSLTASFLWFRFPLFPFVKREKAPKQEAPQKKQSTAKKPKEKKQKGDVQETVNLILDLIYAVLHPLRVFARRFRFRKVQIEVIVGGEDAAETAINYGKISALVYGGMALLRNAFRIKVDRIHVGCDFKATETTERVSFLIKIRLTAILAAAFCMLGRFLKKYLSRDRQKKSEHKGKLANKSSADVKQTGGNTDDTAK